MGKFESWPCLAVVIIAPEQNRHKNGVDRVLILVGASLRVGHFGPDFIIARMRIAWRVLFFLSAQSVDWLQDSNSRNQFCSFDGFS